MCGKRVDRGSGSVSSIFYSYSCGLCRFKADSISELEEHGFIRHCNRDSYRIHSRDEMPLFTLPFVIEGIGESRLHIPVRRGKK